MGAIWEETASLPPETLQAARAAVSLCPGTITAPLVIQIIAPQLVQAGVETRLLLPISGISLSIGDAEQKGGAGGTYEAASGSPGTEAECPEPLRPAYAQLISAPQAPLVVPLKHWWHQKPTSLKANRWARRTCICLDVGSCGGNTRRSCTPCLGGDLPQLVNIMGEKNAEQVVAIQFTGCIPSLLSAFQHRSNKPSSSLILPSVTLASLGCHIARGGWEETPRLSPAQMEGGSPPLLPHVTKAQMI